MKLAALHGPNDFRLKHVGTTFPKDYAGKAAGIGSPDHRSDVSRILHSVQKQPCTGCFFRFLLCTFRKIHNGKNTLWTRRFAQMLCHVVGNFDNLNVVWNFKLVSVLKILRHQDFRNRLIKKNRFFDQMPSVKHILSLLDSRLFLRKFFPVLDSLIG